MCSRAWREMELRGFLISWATVVRKVDLALSRERRPPVLFLQKELLLVVFLQMKIENNAADSTYRDKCQKNICQPVCFRGKRSYNVRKNGMRPDTVLYIGQSPSRETIRARLFSSISTVKNNGKHEEGRHTAMISAAGKKTSPEKTIRKIMTMVIR